MLTNGNKEYSNKHPRDKKPTEEKNIKVAKYEPGKTKLTDVAKMKRPSLVRHLNNMELPETNAKDFNDEHLKELLIKFAPDMFKDSRD